MVAEIPFQIVENIGIRVFAPPRLKEIKGVAKPYKFTIPGLRKYIGEVYSDESILILWPPHARIPYPALILIDLTLTNNLKTLVISFRYSEEELKRVLKTSLKELIEDEELLDKVLEKHMMFEAFNPYGMSLEELRMVEIELAEKYNPDMVVLHGTEMLLPVLKTDPRRYYDLLVNQAYQYKSMGKVLVKVASYMNEEQFRLYSALSDIIIRVFMRKAQEGFEPYLYLWRKGEDASNIKT